VIRVTYQLEEGNREREINGIIEGARHIRANTGYILTYNQEDEFAIDDINIKVVPAWKWLLDTRPG
jgi:predicted AAA+ superfamily ATPase